MQRGVKYWCSGARGKAMWVCSCGVVLERTGVGSQEGALKENMLVELHLLILLLFSASFNGIARKSKNALMELPLTQSWEHFSI